MKKNIIKTAILALVALPVFTSCELDQFPTTALVEGDIWKSPDDPKKFELGLISNFRSIAASGNYIKDIQVDYYQPNVGYGNRNGATYRWKFGGSDTDDQTSYWANMYYVISQVNYFLSKVGTVTATVGEDKNLTVDVTLNPDLGITDEDDIKIVKHYIGEAYFLRAYCYFGLAQRYCKDYEGSATAKSELGLPLVTTVDIDGRPSRATLEDTKAFIETDMAIADKLFLFKSKTDMFESCRFCLPKQVLTALEARFYLWAHDYDRALELADELINDPEFPLATTVDDFAAMWKNDEGSEFIYVPVVNDDERMSFSNYHGYNATYSKYYASYGSWYNPDFLPCKTLIDSYSASDIRGKVFFEAVDVVFGFGSSFCYDMGGLKLLNKYPGNPALVKEGEDPDHTYVNAPKPFRIAEQYLIAAEAAYRLGEEADAQDYLNLLRDARGLADTSNSGDDLFKDIQDEWYREFVGEGFRLDCLKRWHLGFVRDGAYQRTSNSSTSPVVATNVQEIKFEVDANDKRFVWEIPTNDLETNPNFGGANWY